MTSPDRLLKAPEAAAHLAVCTRTLRKLRQEGRIDYVLIGDAIRYSIADLDRFIAESRTRCVSIKGPTRHIGGSMPPSPVSDIAAARANRENAKRKRPRIGSSIN